jgi:hypothetical protein
MEARLGQHTPADQWNKFYETYPGMSGYLQVSVPVIKGRTAIVLTRWSGGTLGVEADILTLQKYWHRMESPEDRTALE